LASVSNIGFWPRYRVDTMTRSSIMESDSMATSPIVPWVEFKVTLDIPEADAEGFCERHSIPIIRDGKMRFVRRADVRRALRRLAARAQPGRRVRQG